MDQEMFLKMAAMTEAATKAATAAETALASLAGGSGGASSSSSSSMQAGLQAAWKILRDPEPYNGSDPHSFMTWKFVFTSWLNFVEPKFKALLEKVEQLDTVPSMSDYSTDEQALSIKLFSILTSYMRGKCLNMVQAEKSTQDGFKLWKLLRQEFLPSTRSISLAVAQALASYPAFPKDKSVLECIVQYERLVQEFETLGSTTYPHQELKIATLIRCAESKLREHLTLTITESSSYQNLKATMLSHEQASKTWNQESILRSLTVKTEGGMIRTDAGGPAPMEIDRIEDKGKGKGKSKSKGKGKWWQIPFYPNGKGNKGKVSVSWAKQKLTTSIQQRDQMQH